MLFRTTPTKVVPYKPTNEDPPLHLWSCSVHIWVSKRVSSLKREEGLLDIALPQERKYSVHFPFPGLLSAADAAFGLK
jgi:hypothetical protein